MTTGNHPRHQLDELLLNPVRFSIAAILSGVDEAEFQFVRDTVEVSTSGLSKHVAALEAVGYVKVKKGYVGKRPRTWLSLTRKGQSCYATQLAALRAITETASGEPPR